MGCKIYLTAQWANIADDKLIIFFTIPKKIGFGISCKLSGRQFAWNAKAYFFGENIEMLKNSTVILTHHVER